MGQAPGARYIAIYDRHYLAGEPLAECHKAGALATYEHMVAQGTLIAVAPHLVPPPPRPIPVGQAPRLAPLPAIATRGPGAVVPLPAELASWALPNAALIFPMPTIGCKIDADRIWTPNAT